MYSKYFPNTANERGNPAIQLFGNRLYKDQTVSELLVEFLLVAFSAKKIGENGEFSSALPDKELLITLNEEKLEYAPKARLNLKLFSFLGASRLDSRHLTHRNHHKELFIQLKDSIAEGSDKDETIRTIEDLFVGFQGAGSGRTWCAQSFLPISKSLLACESIWAETKAKHLTNEEWTDLLNDGSNYFEKNKHNFLARGGEVIYLQLCNALKQPIDIVEQWCEKNDLGFNQDEQNPAWLHQEIEKELNEFMKQCPDTLNELAEFIDSYLDPVTPAKTDNNREGTRFVTAGYCNLESWQEGYLFAVELRRLLKSKMGIIDKIYLLETACAMQILRTLAMQSVRAKDSQSNYWPDYWLAVSAPDENRPIIKRLSQHCVKEIEKLIFHAIRNESKVVLPEEPVNRGRTLKEADQKYGGKLFLGLSKRIGFIVPKLGGGARFIINDQLLRFLVVTTLPSEGRLTFDTFINLLERHYGLVFGAEGFNRASQWSDDKSIYLPMDTDNWFKEMLEAAGFLIHLSDSFALVYNPADSTN